MKNLSVKCVLCVFGLLLCIYNAHATNFTNPSFETGDFSGWTTQDLSRPFSPITVLPGGPEPPWDFFSPIVPTDGSFVAYTGFDGDGPGTIMLGQQVTVDRQLISFDYQAGYDLTYGATQDRTFGVKIYDGFGGAELGSFTLLTAPAPNTLYGAGIQNTEVDLSDFSGQSVFFAFEWFVPEDYTGPASFWLDNILSEYSFGGGFVELHTSVPRVALYMTDSFQGMAGGRMLHLRQSGHEAFAAKDPLDGLLLASAGDVADIGPITADGDKSKNFWGKLYGVTGDVEGDATISGYEYNIGGFVLGGDFKPCSGVSLGAMAGISSGNADTDFSDEFDVTSYQLGLYATYENGPYYLDSVLSYASSDYDASRSTPMGTARSDYDGYELGAAAELGYVMFKDNTIFEPYLGTQYIYVDQDGFSETGAGAMNMAINSRDTYSWKVMAGGRLSGVYKQKNDAVFVPELHFAFKHELGDDNDVVVANFVTTPAANSFVLEGLDHKRHTLELGVGLKMLQANNLDLDIDLTTEFNGDQQAYLASVGLKYSW